jgi:peptide/nickel transport system substrate-binding protein
VQGAAALGISGTTIGINVSASHAAQDTPTGGSVNMLWRTPETLNPLFSTSGSEQQVERLMFGALLKLSDKFEIVPDLAETIESSTDALTYTFTLKEGLVFNDGQPLTVADVIFTFERAVDSRTGSLWRSRLLAIAGAAEFGEQQADSISGLEALDDRTLRVTLAEPNAVFLATLGGFSGLGILPKHILETVPPDQMKPNSFSLAPTVSAGAFEFARYETDQFLELRRNETYPFEKPSLDSIFCKILTPDVAIAQMETGELDLMGGVPVSEVERLRGIANVTVVSVASPSYTRLVPNHTREYLADRRVRQAMLCAIDRQAIVESILMNEARVINSPIIGPEWMGTPEFDTYAFDPERSRQLLSEAGWDTNRTLELITVPGSKEEEAYLPIIQQQFNDVGIKMEVVNVDLPEKGRRARANTDFDLFTDGGDLFGMDPAIATQWFHTKSWAPDGNNRARYSNPEADELFDQGEATTDQAVRIEIYTQLAEILNRDVPELFLWSPNSIFAYNNRLVGFMPPGYVDNRLWNAEEWSVTG